MDALQGVFWHLLGMGFVAYSFFFDQLRNPGLLSTGIGLIVIGMTNRPRRVRSPHDQEEDR